MTLGGRDRKVNKWIRIMHIHDMKHFENLREIEQIRKPKVR